MTKQQLASQLQQEKTLKLHPWCAGEKEKDYQIRILYPAKISSKNEDKTSTFSDMQNQTVCHQQTPQKKKNLKIVLQEKEK